MRVAFVTLHREINFGSALQSVALYWALAQLGHQPVLIDYTRGGRSGLGALRHRIRTFDGSPLVRIFHAVEASIRLWIAWQLQFQPFLTRNTIRSIRYKGVRALRRSPPAADVYLTGSDQVWNSDYNEGIDRGFFLDFGLESVQRGSYGASFGMSSVPAHEVILTSDLLKRYQFIGVREPEAVSLVAGLGLLAEQVVDPTLLFDAATWRARVPQSSRHNRRPYVLVYCVEDERREQAAEISRKMARYRGWDVVQVAPGGRLDGIRGLPGELGATPARFLGLVDRAEFVVTSSFHGTVFALTFGKDFVSLSPPQYGSRVASLLADVGLSDRLISSSEQAVQLAQIEWSEVSKRLELMRAHSWNFLQKVGRP